MSQISISCIKSHTNTNLNRGDDNQPKNSRFGDSIRTLVSSQCQNYAIREYLNNTSKFQDAYVATKMFPQWFRDTLIKMGMDEKKAQKICNELKKSGKNAETASTEEVSNSKEKEEDKGAKILLQTRRSVLEAVAKEVFDNPSIDIMKRIGELDLVTPLTSYELMSGRMSTDEKISNRESACNTAYGISINSYSNYKNDDFFIAVDSIREEGAGQLGTRHLVSPTLFYQHVFNLNKMYSNDSDVNGNLRNGETKKSFVEKVMETINACIMVNPVAMQACAFSNSLPSAILVEFNDNNDMISHADAFVKASNNNPIEEGIAKLTSFINETEIGAFGLEANRFWFVPNKDYAKYAIEGATNVDNYKELISTIRSIVTEYVNNF